MSKASPVQGKSKQMKSSTPTFVKGGGSGSIGQGFKRKTKEGGPGPEGKGKLGFPGAKALSATAKVSR